MARVYFASGGSEANEFAWKLARQYFVETGKPQKYKAIARWQGYHGVTLATLSLSGRTDWRRIYSPLLLPVPHIAPPYAYRCAFCAGAGHAASPAPTSSSAPSCTKGPETVAMFFAEPVDRHLGAGGRAASRAYYARVREICDRYDVLFVADEVLCGYGRCGRPFAISEWDVEPDIITLGKAIASGYAPLAAMVVSDKIRQALARRNGPLRARAHLLAARRPPASSASRCTRSCGARDCSRGLPASAGISRKSSSGWPGATR